MLPASSKDTLICCTHSEEMSLWEDSLFKLNRGSVVSGPTHDPVIHQWLTTIPHDILASLTKLSWWPINILDEYLAVSAVCQHGSITSLYLNSTLRHLQSTVHGEVQKGERV